MTRILFAFIAFISFCIITVNTHATPAVVPSCPVGETNEPSLTLTTYDTTGYNTYPSNHVQYNTLIISYAIPAKEFGTGLVSTVNDSGNPYGTNSHYLSLFTGYIQAPVTGIYGIGVDGDDAIEVIIDGVVITGWYGGHGRAGSAQFTVNVNLDAGYHTLEFRHQERTGGDNYYFYWRKPGDAGYTIVPPGNLSSCQTPPVLLPAVTTTCPLPSPKLIHETYNTTGYNTYPTDHASYNVLVTNYATSGNLFGSGLITNINGSGNPYGSNDNYLSLFTGYLNAPTSGLYYFGIDGDDAVEVIIDGVAVTGWYGGHGRAGSAQFIQSIGLEAGYHDIEFRHQERNGGDNYYLYWQKPGDASLSIISGANLNHCPFEASISLKKISQTISDPYNLTINPKAIPGAVIRYTLTAKNTGSAPADNNTINDSLDNIITTQQVALWVANSITLQTPNFYGGVQTALTDATDSDQASFIDTASNRVITVNCGTLTTNQSCIVTYDIEVK